METEIFRFVLFMQDEYFEHPGEEALERYLLKQCGEDELERVESHVLGCESCVARLEDLELEIVALKSALAQWQEEEEARAVDKARDWRRWFAIPTVAWAGAVAALAVGIAVIPHFANPNGPVANFSLSAYRGLESVAVPEGRPLHFTLNANDLPAGGADVSVVDSTGDPVWSGAAQIRDNQVSVTIPRIKHAGAYFVRLYSKPADGAEPELLREYSINVR